jgi:hypothetical protein
MTTLAANQRLRRTMMAENDRGGLIFIAVIPILGLADSHFGRLDSQELWIVRFLVSKRESGPGFSHGRANRHHAERSFGERSSASGEPRLGWSPGVSAFGAGDGS